MTYLSILVHNRVGQTWITTSTTYELCSSACAHIFCTLMHQDVSLVRTRSHFWDDSLESEVFEWISKRWRPQWIGQSQRAKGIYASGLFFPITCTSVARTTLIWLGHCPISLKSMWSGAGLAPQKRLLRPYRRVSYMTQFWLCQILICLSVSSVTLLILPSAVLCYKQMLRDASVSSLLNPANAKLLKELSSSWQRATCYEVCSSPIQISYAWL